MVKKSTLDKFVRLGGYDIVKKRRKNGKWKNISEASRRVKIDRSTIYDILEEYPEPPRKTKPKYIEEFEESEGLRRLSEMYEKKLSFSSWSQTRKDVMDAWKRLDKKDPVSWDEEDFQKIWNMDIFYCGKAKGFEIHHATSLHRLMRAIKRHDLIDKFKGKVMPQGIKKGWFLHDEEIIRLIDKIETLDTLCFAYCGINGFGRASALLDLILENLDFIDNRVTVFEPKTGDTINKFPPLPLMKFLKQYVKDRELNPKDRLFDKEYNFYNKALRTAGKKAKLQRTVTTHILKHTFVSQGHRHGLSRETVSQTVGTQDRTIKTYYLSVDEQRLRHEMQGLELDVVPFHQWIEALHPYFQEKYQQLIGD